MCQVRPRRLRGSRALKRTLDGAHLVRAQDDLGQFVVLAREEDEITQDAQHALWRDERLDERFEIAPRRFLFPVEEVLSGVIPRRAVVKLDEVRESENLQQREQFGTLAVVTAHLVERIGDAFEFRCGFGLDQDNGNAVDKKDDIGADGVDAIGEFEFVGNVIDVRTAWCVLRIEIYQAQVAFAAFGFDKDGLESFEEFPRLQVAFNRRRDADEAFGFFFRLQVIHDAGIERLHLLDKDIPEEGAGFATAQAQRFIGRQVGPAGFGGVADEGILDGGAFAMQIRHACILWCPLPSARLVLPRSRLLHTPAVQSRARIQDTV